MLLNRIKVLLGISSNDNEELLIEIVELTKSKILNYINKSDSDEMDYFYNQKLPQPNQNQDNS